MALTKKRILELFKYVPRTGELINLTRRGPTTKVGRAAGSNCHGHLYVRFDCASYPVHHLVWFLFNGRLPIYEIDHINGIKNDNRIENLRDVPHRVNMENVRAPSEANTSGYLGVTWKKASKKWCAQIKVKGRKRHLGLFVTAEDAHQKYLSVKREEHDGCTI